MHQRRDNVKYYFIESCIFYCGHSYMVSPALQTYGVQGHNIGLSSPTPHHCS